MTTNKKERYLLNKALEALHTLLGMADAKDYFEQNSILIENERLKSENERLRKENERLGEANIELWTANQLGVQVKKKNQEQFKEYGQTESGRKADN